MSHRFHFFRAGGVDQVSLRDGADLLALPDLDQKLWVALAMPIRGLDLDPDTLKLLDHDGDGRIRVQDILSAVDWAKVTFKQPGDLLSRKDEVALGAIADDKVVAAARRMLGDLGKRDASSITVADTAAVTKAFADTVLNGDGIVIPGSTQDAELRKVIEDAIARAGSVTDRSGHPGIDSALAQAFFQDVDTRAAWLTEGKTATVVALGPSPGAAAEAFAAVRAKIDDYFTRCRIAAFDPRGAAAMGGQEPDLVALGAHTLSASDEQLAQLPLAAIDPRARLPLDGALNPAWTSRIETFVRTVVTPILGDRKHLTPDDLAAIDVALGPYQAWLDRRPVTKVDDLAEDWIARLAGAELRKKLDEVIAADAALAEEYAQISAVTKAVHLQRDFGRILRNFVSFSDFYARQDGVFQAGTLYLDARALRLCVAVSDAAKHGAQIPASDMFLAYCDLSRQGETRQIVAALTNGDVDSVFAGRNGVFYDRDGKDWDATITKVIANPISIRAAFWSPYKKLVKTIEDTVAKRAQASEARSSSAMEAAGTSLASADTKALSKAASPPAPGAPGAAEDAAGKPAKIDLGTVAAIGVAIGGIGTLVGALLANLFGLGKWLPLGVIALLLMVSGPSMLLAWLKLRRRNLGPILEANGWAINGRTRINVAFGAAMTELPRLPPGAKRSLDDPFADKRTPWKIYVAFVVLLGLFGAWYLGKFDDILPRSLRSVSALGELSPAYKPPAPPAAPAPPAPAPAAPPAAPK